MPKQQEVTLKAIRKVVQDEVQPLKKNFQEFVDFSVKNVVTKQDLKEHTDRALKTFATKDDLADLKRDLPTKQDMDRNTDKILASNDKLAKKLNTFLTEKEALSARVDQNRNRIQQLETHAGI